MIVRGGVACFNRHLRPETSQQPFSDISRGSSPDKIINVLLPEASRYARLKITRDLKKKKLHKCARTHIKLSLTDKL